MTITSYLPSAVYSWYYPESVGPKEKPSAELTKSIIDFHDKARKVIDKEYGQGGSKVFDEWKGRVGGNHTIANVALPGEILSDMYDTIGERGPSMSKTDRHSKGEEKMREHFEAVKRNRVPLSVLDKQLRDKSIWAGIKTVEQALKTSEGCATTLETAQSLRDLHTQRLTTNIDREVVLKDIKTKQEELALLTSSFSIDRSHTSLPDGDSRMRDADVGAGSEGTVLGAIAGVTLAGLAVWYLTRSGALHTGRDTFSTGG